MPVNSGFGNKESLRGRFLRFFHLKNADGGSGHSSSSSTSSSSSSSLASAQDLFAQELALSKLNATSDPVERLMVLRALLPWIRDVKFEYGALEALWLCCRDLLTVDCLVDSHHTLVQFLIALCNSQYCRLGVCRAAILSTLRAPERFNCDLSDLLQLLYAVTDGGRDADSLEDQIGDVLVAHMNLLPQVRVCHEEFLTLIEIVVKYQAAHLNEVKLKSLIEHVCSAASDPLSSIHCVHLCLDVFGVVVCYSFWPKGTLKRVVNLLCVLVNRKDCCQKAWTVARNMLCSDNGNAIICYMCNIMQNGNADQNPLLCRGAVFNAGMALWGSQRVESLSITPTAILPSMECAVQTGNAYIVFEVAVSIQRLVRKYGRIFEMLTWSVVIDLLWMIYRWIEEHEDGCEVASASTTVVQEELTEKPKDMLKKSQVSTYFQSTLNTVEMLMDGKVYSGPMEEYFSLIERCASVRPENSLKRLLAYRQQMWLSLTSNWPDAMCRLIQVFFFDETRPNVRICALQTFQHLLSHYGKLCPDDMVHAALSALLNSLLVESDCQVLKAVVDLVFTVAAADDDEDTYMMELVDTGHRFLLEPLAGDVDCVQHFLVALLQLLKTKWTLAEPTILLKMINLIISSVSVQYDRNGSAAAAQVECRCRMLGFLLSLRCHPGSGRLAYVDESSDSLLISPSIGCAEQQPAVVVNGQCSGTSSSDTERSEDGDEAYGPPPQGGIVCQPFSVHSVWAVLLQCIRLERYWPVLKPLLVNLPPFLRNRPLILTYKEGVESLCIELLALLEDVGRPSEMQPRWGSMDVPSCLELNELVYPVLAETVAYADVLSVDVQRRLAMAVQTGIKSPKSTQAILAILHCFVRIADIVKPMARSLISQLYELPYSPTLAICVLELLGQLRVTAGLLDTFTVKQFTKILLITCVCLNPFRFTSFIVARAFSALISWFHSAPAPMRPSLVKIVLEKLRPMVYLQGVDQGFDDSDLQCLFREIFQVIGSLLLYHVYDNCTGSEGWSSNNDLTAYGFCRLDTVHLCVDGQIMSVSSLLHRPHTNVDDQQKLFVSTLKRRRHWSISGCVSSSAADLATSRDDDWLKSLKCAESRPHDGKVGVADSRMSTCVEVIVRNCLGKEVWLFSAESGSGLAVCNGNSRYSLAAGMFRLFGDCMLPGLLSAQGAASEDSLIFPICDGEDFRRALKNLDRIAEFDTHKVGVVYVAPNQVLEAEILANADGSERYKRFLYSLGRVTSLNGSAALRCYLGGLDTSGRDGNYTICWQEPFTQFVFHVATMMPNRSSDPQCLQKKLHIGNNFVSIVYNDSDLEYNVGTISGQFSSVAIVVHPVDSNTLSLTVKAKDEVTKWLALKELQVPDDLAAQLCRQIASRADLSAKIWHDQKSGDQLFVSNYLERWRQIKQVKEKFCQWMASASPENGRAPFGHKFFDRLFQ